MNMWDGIGVSNYHSLQSQLNKSFSKGLMVKVNYTFGKSLSMADEDGWVGLPLLQLRSRSTTELRSLGLRPHAHVHRRMELRTAGRQGQEAGDHQQGRRLHRRRLEIERHLRGLLRHAVHRDRQRLFAAGHRQQPDGGPDRTRHEDRRQGPGAVLLRPAQLHRSRRSSSTRPACTAFGTMGRNVLRGPGYWQLSPAIYKNFKIKEKVNAEFRAESTNFTNTPIWGNPNAGFRQPAPQCGRFAEHRRRGSVPELHVDHRRDCRPAVPLRICAWRSNQVAVQQIRPGRKRLGRLFQSWSVYARCDEAGRDNVPHSRSDQVFFLCLTAGLAAINAQRCGVSTYAGVAAASPDGRCRITPPIPPETCILWMATVTPATVPQQFRVQDRPDRPHHALCRHFQDRLFRRWRPSQCRHA